MIPIIETQISAVLRQFVLEEADAQISAPQEITIGHINRTYLLEARGQQTRRYILQRVNTVVFTKPVELMENLVGVTDYISARGGRTLTVYPARDGKPYYIDGEGGFWRCHNYVENSHSLDAANGPDDAYRAAKAFGEFQLMLDGYPIGELHETIPNFHNTQKRYEALEKAIDANLANRLNDASIEIDFARARKASCAKLLPLVEAGNIPLRVTHNDTKLNNVLFDNDTHEALCVVDLDTIMPGLSLYDFGDSLRFLGNTAKEDERDLTKVQFSMPLFEAYAKGYLEACRAALTPDEIKMLPFSVILMTYECGMRFLTDYLNGDTYFRVHLPDDNLARCRTQFKLIEHIERLLPEMEAFVQRLAGN